jgi:hypothetical protein
VNFINRPVFRRIGLALFVMTLAACVPQADMVRLQERADVLSRQLEDEKQRLALIRQGKKPDGGQGAGEKAASPEALPPAQ